MINLGLLILSAISWNTAFFGNYLTCFLVVPAIIFWVILISKLSDPVRKLRWFLVFVYGFLWGALCIAPQFWWLPRAAHLYPESYGLGQGYGFFTFFLVLFSVTHTVFTFLQVFVCSFFKKSWIRSVLCVFGLWPYFFYLANYGFAPLGEIKGYPFLWPFLPLAKSETFLKVIAPVCKTSEAQKVILKNKLKHFSFVQLDKSRCARLDQTHKPASFVGQKIREALKNESVRACGDGKTIIFLAPESAFPYPLDLRQGYVDIWSYEMPKNSHFLIGTRRQIAPENVVQHNWLQNFMLDETRQIVSTGCCQATAWIHDRKMVRLLDKKTLCPFSEAGILKGENMEFERFEIEGLKLVPIVCYDFFSNFSWLSSVDTSGELTVLLANESWFPKQTTDIIRCFVKFSSAWYGRPIVYVSARYGLNLVSFDGVFE
ncbi:hypothetical protein ACFLY6_03195 [Candidatus Dependentiae bacterium]